MEMLQKKQHSGQRPVKRATHSWVYAAWVNKWFQILLYSRNNKRISKKIQIVMSATPTVKSPNRNRPKTASQFLKQTRLVKRCRARMASDCQLRVSRQQKETLLRQKANCSILKASKNRVLSKKSNNQTTQKRNLLNKIL